MANSDKQTASLYQNKFINRPLTFQTLHPFKHNVPKIYTEKGNFYWVAEVK